jgi:hypothetical protein
VDALGVGGIDLWIEMEGRKHPLHATRLWLTAAGSRIRWKGKWSIR